MVFLKRIYRKLAKRHPELCKSIGEHLAELSTLEKDNCPSIDMSAEAFSKIMEVIFVEGIKAIDENADEDICSLFGTIGYHMGKWIYLIDAVDDIEENIKSGAYNPLIYRFSFDPETESAKQFRDRIEEDLKFNLYHYLAMISNCLGALDIKKNKGIIENVIYFGLNRKTEEIIAQTDSDKRI